MGIALTSLCFVMAILLVSFIPLASAQESSSCSAPSQNKVSNLSNQSCDDGFSINVGLAKMTGGAVVQAPPQKAGLIESVFSSIAKFFRNIFG